MINSFCIVLLYEKVLLNLFLISSYYLVKKLSGSEIKKHVLNV